MYIKVFNYGAYLMKKLDFLGSDCSRPQSDNLVDLAYGLDQALSLFQYIRRQRALWALRVVLFGTFVQFGVVFILLGFDALRYTVIKPNI